MADNILKDNSTGVLLSNKHGLPWEIWRLVMAYLPLPDLCRISCVCRAWNDLVHSLDSTRWKSFYTNSIEWKLPQWPLNEYSEPASWKAAYRDQYLASRFWTLGAREPQQANCLYVFKRKRDHKTLHVGRGKEHETVRSALSVANEYDKIVIHPGNYDEQIEMSSKIPFEIVGCGPLGSVTVVMCIEQIAVTGRICNLVLQAPWLTKFILKVRSGHLQVDNCIIEGGLVYVQNPGTCHFRYCTFRHTSMTLQHVNASIIENCEFSQTECASINVEGFPKECRNWTYRHMKQMTNLLHETKEKKPTKDKDTESILSKALSNKQVNNVPSPCGSKPRVYRSQVKRRLQTYDDDEDTNSDTGALVAPSREGGGGAKHVDGVSSLTESDNSFENDDDDGLVYLEESESTDSSDLEHDNDGSVTSDDSFENISDSDSDHSLSDEEPVIQLANPKQREESAHPNGTASRNSDTLSMCSETHPKPIAISTDHTMRKIVEHVHGCTIRHCRFSQSKGAVLVSCQAHAIITECDISNVGYGVRCIQNARVVLLKNEIHHCRSSGIFVLLAATGLIAGNDIHSNAEAGIDIRKNADPLVQCNRIHRGKRSGIVVLGSGRGQIKNNDIYLNKEAGIYILYRGNPVISENRIYDGRSAGIAVNEAGRGYIVENVINGNHWGGVDIRHGGDPLVRQNVICNGQGDGVVIGEKGKGSIENNIISGNTGSGIWIMGANQPLLHGNQINNNGDSGIAFVGNEESQDQIEEAAAVSRDDEFQIVRTPDAKRILNDEDSTPNRKKCSLAMVEYNSIYYNAGKGIILQHVDVVKIESNAVHGNRSDGILVDQPSQTCIRNNSVTCNAGSGIISTPLVKVNIHDNGIYDNRDHGISCQGETVIGRNDIIGNQMCGVLAMGSSTVHVTDNRIQSASEPAVAVMETVQGVVNKNRVFDTGPGVQNSSVHCVVSENETVLASMSAEIQHSGVKQSTPSSGGAWLLEDPPRRPLITPPPALPTVPAHHVISRARVHASLTGRSQQGSKLCIIL